MQDSEPFFPYSRILSISPMVQIGTMIALIYKLYETFSNSNFVCGTARHLDVGRDEHKNIVAVLDTGSRHGPTPCAVLYKSSERIAKLITTTLMCNNKSFLLQSQSLEYCEYREIWWNSQTCLLSYWGLLQPNWTDSHSHLFPWLTESAERLVNLICSILSKWSFRNMILICWKSYQDLLLLDMSERFSMMPPSW